MTTTAPRRALTHMNPCPRGCGGSLTRDDEGEMRCLSCARPAGKAPSGKSPSVASNKPLHYFLRPSILFVRRLDQSDGARSVSLMFNWGKGEHRGSLRGFCPYCRAVLVEYQSKPTAKKYRCENRHAVRVFYKDGAPVSWV